MGKTVIQSSSQRIAELGSNEVLEIELPPKAEIISAMLVAQDKTLKTFHLGVVGDILVVRRFLVLVPGVDTNLLGELEFVGKGVITSQEGLMPYFIFEINRP